MKKLNFSQDVTKILRSFTKEISGDLDANLVGIYLFGSLTYNDFNPKRSDIDLVVILQKPVTAKKLAQIKKLHIRLEKENLNWKKRIECSYLPVKMLKNILPPKESRPYYGEGTLYPKAHYGNEWLINNYLLYQHGFTLLGPDFKTLVKPIKIKDVKKACIRDLYTEWKPKIKNSKYLTNPHYQSYLVLNLCRILYTVKQNKLSSKKISSGWVKSKYKQWYNLIQTAKNWKYGKKMKLNKETVGFIKFVLKEV